MLKQVRFKERGPVLPVNVPKIVKRIYEWPYILILLILNLEPSILIGAMISNRSQALLAQ